MKKPWSFIENPFLNATGKSYRLANRISIFHDAALNAASSDPFLLSLYLLYHPVHLAFVAAYTSWLSQEGMQKGKTQSLKELLAQLSGEKIQKWSGAIAQVFPKGSAGYIGLLPNDSGPFQKGTQADKIAAVQSLGEAMDGIPALISLKTEVDAFYLLLTQTMDTQKGSKSITGVRSESVDEARIHLCNAQYEALGALMKHFSTHRDRISHYFDLAAIRHGEQVLFTGHVNVNASRVIARHKWLPGELIKLENEGNTPLQFYFADDKNATPTATSGITLAPGTHVQVNSSQLGKTGDAYLLAFNPDVNLKGQFTVEFM